MSASGPFSRILDPSERSSEILFGLIMVLTFTGTLSVAEAGREDVREMLVGALGCNVAWGIVDGVMYAMATITARARGNVLLRRLRGTSDPGEACELIAGALPPRIASVLAPEEFESIRDRLVKSPPPPAGVSVTGSDLLGAFYVFLLVFLSTFPVTVPFLVFEQVQPALRVSNAVALVMLYLLGHSLAKFTGGRPVRLGLGMLLVGVALVLITIALGG